jgi:hypothetical protein
MRSISFFFLIIFLSINLINCNSSDSDSKSSVRSDEVVIKIQGKSDSSKIHNNTKQSIENKFNYPRVKLFLDFYSGMTKSEFVRVADSLTKQNVLFKKKDDNFWINKNHVNTNLFRYNVSKIMNWPNNISYGIYLDPEFDKHDRLLAIELLNIGLFSKVYSNKYNIPDWPKRSIIEVSKIGEYNKSYDPLDFITHIPESELRKKLENQFYVPKKQNLQVPKSFKDKSRKLDLFETQTYYKKNVNPNSVKNYKKIIPIDERTVLIYEKKWRLNFKKDFSIPFDQIPFDAIMQGYFNLRETQSKQLIKKTYWERFINVTYTTKKYYEDKKPKLQKQKDSIKIDSRNINDEI